jgi:hypothetical protein
MSSPLISLSPAHPTFLTPFAAFDEPPEALLEFPKTKFFSVLFVSFIFGRRSAGFFGRSRAHAVAWSCCREQKLALVNPSPSNQGPPHPPPSSNTPQPKRLTAPAVGGGFWRERKERAPPTLSTGLMADLEGSEGTVGRVGGHWGHHDSGREAGGFKMRAWYTEIRAPRSLPSIPQRSDGPCVSSGMPALPLSDFSAELGEGNSCRNPHKRHVATCTRCVAQPRLAPPARFTPSIVCPSLGAQWKSGPDWQTRLPAGSGLFHSAAQPRSGDAVWNGEGPRGQSSGREQAPVLERESLECLGLKWAGIGESEFIPQPETPDVQIRSGGNCQLEGAQGANSQRLLCELQREETSVTVHETASYTVEATESHSRQLRIVAKNSQEPAPPDAARSLQGGLARYPNTHCHSQGEDVSLNWSRIWSPLGLPALNCTSESGTQTDKFESVKSHTEPFHLRHCPNSAGTVDAGGEPGLINQICSQPIYAQPPPAFEAQPDRTFSRLSPPLIEQARMHVPIHTPAAQHAVSSRYLQQIASRATRGRPVFVQSSEGSGRGWSVGAGAEEAGCGGFPSWLTGNTGSSAATNPLTSPSHPVNLSSSGLATLFTTDIGRIEPQISPPLSPRSRVPDTPGVTHSHPLQIEHRPALFLVPKDPSNRRNRETNQGMPTRLLDLNLPPTDPVEETARELQKTVKGAAMDARKRGVGRKKRAPTIFWALPLKRPEKLRTVRHAVRLPDDHPLLQGVSELRNFFPTLNMLA